MRYLSVFDVCAVLMLRPFSFLLYTSDILLLLYPIMILVIIQSYRVQYQYCSYIHIVWKWLKMSHLNFWILAFSVNFCPIKNNLSGNTVWPQASGFQKLAKMNGPFLAFLINLSTQNVNVARFARNVEWDFFCDFQTPCSVYLFRLLQQSYRFQLSFFVLNSIVLQLFLWEEDASMGYAKNNTIKLQLLHQQLKEINLIKNL